MEDHPAFGDTLLARLSNLGYPAVLERTGSAALELLQKEGHRFGFALIDLELPGRLDGFDVAAWIRVSLPECRVVLVTGHERSDVLSLWRGAPPDGFLEKPFGLADLARELRRLGG